MYKITYRMRNDVITAFLAGIILLAFSFVFYLMFSLRLDVVIYFSIIWFVVAIILFLFWIILPAFLIFQIVYNTGLFGVVW